MYDNNHYDNYVGTKIKILRTFLNYLIKERNIILGDYHKSFYAPVEEIPIIVLNSSQLNYIIYDSNFNAQVAAKKLGTIKDIFVFGCTVALRISDLMTLTKANLIEYNSLNYLKVKSTKTGSDTIIKLPPYCIDILEKYKNQTSTLLPSLSKGYFDVKVKELARLLPDDFELVKTRERRGKPVIIYKDAVNREHFKLSDHVSAHTMRRTAITNMLNLGVPENVVRKISGHAPNSKEFYRYVKLSQTYIDDLTDEYFERLKQNTTSEIHF